MQHDSLAQMLDSIKPLRRRSTDEPVDLVAFVE
jgi:hypothetical protein